MEEISNNHLECIKALWVDIYHTNWWVYRISSINGNYIQKENIIFWGKILKGSPVWIQTPPLFFKSKLPAAFFYRWSLQSRGSHHHPFAPRRWHNVWWSLGRCFGGTVRFSQSCFGCWFFVVVCCCCLLLLFAVVVVFFFFLLLLLAVVMVAATVLVF